MERGSGNGKGGGNGKGKREWGEGGTATITSIPAKAGISAAKPHSPKATIAMFRFAENSRCRENEIPAFAGMEDSFFFAARFSSFPFPPLFHSREGGNLFPRQREIPRSGMVACRRMRLSPQRFLPSQEWKGEGREWKGEGRNGREGRNGKRGRE